MNAFAAEEAAREIAEVNVVPLADVSLVLLIILLVLSPMMAQSSMRVKSAAQDSSPAPAVDPLFAPQPDFVLVVGLDEHGLTLAGKAYDDPGTFMGALKDALSGREDRKVFLAPGPETPHGLVVHTIETIKSCGAESVALVQTQDEPIRPAEAAR